MPTTITPIKDYNQYLSYREALKAIDVLVKYYQRNPRKADDVNDGDKEAIDAKKKLVRTLYKTLNGVGGADVTIADSGNKRINRVFLKYFSDKENKTILRKHLESTVSSQYKHHISSYQEHVLTALPTAPLTDLVAGVEVTGHKIKEMEKNPEKRYSRETRSETARYLSLAQRLNQTIESRLETEPIKNIARAHRVFKNNVLGNYREYLRREEEIKAYFRKLEEEKK